MRVPAPLVLVLLGGCAGNDCVDMCQQYEQYLDQCGYGWSTAFEEEGWATINDCYDDYWEAGDMEQDWCMQETTRYAAKACE